MNSIQKSSTENHLQASHPWLRFIIWAGAGVVVLGTGIILALLILWANQLGAIAQIPPFLSWLFAANPTQVTWYITRSAGIMAYLLLWLSTMWGLAVPSKILNGILHGTFTFEFHQFISLLAIAFLATHIVVLMFDQYLTFSVFQILFPFISAYRPLWVGIGIISMYLVLLVTITFYLRDRIGPKAFRAIHTLSLLSFFGAAVHGLLSGTDSPLMAMQIMYAVTLFSVVFMTAYWVAEKALKHQPNRAARPVQ